MKRILIVIGTPLLNAGVPRVMMDIFDSLCNADNYSFDFLVLSKENGYYDEKILSKGGIIHYAGMKNSHKDRLHYALYVLLRPWQVFKVIRKGHYDIIHSNCGFLSGWDMLIGKICGVPIRISHAHGKYKPTSINLKIGQKLLYKFATERISCSKNAGLTLFAGKKYKVILNSVDFSIYKQIYKKEHEGINLLQVGYFCGIKNQLFSIELTKRLLDKGISTCLYLIGFDKNDGYLPKMHEAIEQNNLQKNVVLLPHDYDKFSLYPVVDFMLMPSTTEGLPVVAIECQAANLACVTSTAVPVDVDMGLLKRLPLSINAWVEYITLGKTNQKLDKKKMAEFSRETFLNKITAVYNA